MQELVERLQTRLRNYKRQIEEAEEIAALNLAKFRKTQVGFFEQVRAAHYKKHPCAARLFRCRSVAVPRQFLFVS
jgi:hypothetical protein